MPFIGPEAMVRYRVGRAWEVPYVFWFVGGTDVQTYIKARQAKQINAIPSNHSPKFAPALHPTLEAGLQAMLTAASAWLCDKEQNE